MSPQYWCRRADRFVVGVVEGCLLYPAEHVVDTLKKAKNRAVKIVLARDQMAARKLCQAKYDEEIRVRQEIEERKLAAEAADQAEREAEVDRIAGAFNGRGE